jgi:S1-C subfamily serine protease
VALATSTARLITSPKKRAWVAILAFALAISIAPAADARPADNTQFTPISTVLGPAYTAYSATDRCDGLGYRVCEADTSGLSGSRTGIRYYNGTRTSDFLWARMSLPWPTTAGTVSEWRLIARGLDGGTFFAIAPQSSSTSYDSNFFISGGLGSYRERTWTSTWTSVGTNLSMAHFALGITDWGSAYIASYQVEVRTSGGTSPAQPANSLDSPTGLGDSRASQFLPSSAQTSVFKTFNPGAAPIDLVKLSADVGKSVVTLICGSAKGSAWSANVTMPSGFSSQGFRSYLITNEHVISNCKDGGVVSGIDSNGANFSATVVGYTTENDLAALVTSHSIPGLSWQGERPAIGWWAGVIGSPYELSGALSLGVVSSVVGDALYTTAPLNPGNSGGPLFDREGRVLAVATAKRVDSEGMGFAVSLSSACGLLLDCAGRQPWGDPAALPARLSEPSSQEEGGQQAFRSWTQGMADGSIKFYARGVVGMGKVSFVHNGREIAWVRASSGGDSKINLAGDGMVRTVRLLPGRNVLEVYVNGQRVVRRIATG